MSPTVSIALSPDVWRSVELALLDFLRFGPGDFTSDYIPDEHLEKARKEIHKLIGEKS